MDLAVQVKRNNLSDALAEASRFESFEDWPWFLMYKELDETYPKSKFILTIRRDAEILQRSISVCQPTDVVARLSAKLSEEAADQNLPIGLDSHGNDTAVPNIEAGINRRVLWVEPSEANATQPAKLTEEAADQNLPVGLHYDATHEAVRIRIER